MVKTQALFINFYVAWLKSPPPPCTNMIRAKEILEKQSRCLDQSAGRSYAKQYITTNQWVGFLQNS